MDGVFQDVRFAVRTLSGRPVFTLVVLLTLTLGIGATTSIFSVVNGVLLRPFPYPDADRLVVFWNTNPERGQDQYRMAAPDFFEYQRSASSFSGMTLVAGATGTLTDHALPPLRVDGALVSSDFFSVLGVRPLMGRAFRPEENQGDHRIAVLSHALWRGRFGGDPEIVGKSMTLDGTTVQVVGVMPPVPLPIGGSSLQLPGPDAQIYWKPLDYTVDWVADFGAHVMAVVARLENGVTQAQAQAEMSALALALEESRQSSGQGVIVRDLADQVVGDVRHNLVILMGAVGLLLLMACGNLANLLLGRAAERQRELAVRTAMGARRSRLIRQILTEVLLLASLGGLAGLALARVGGGALLRLVPSSLPRQSEVGVDTTVFFFTLVTVGAVTLLAGLLPAIQAGGGSLGMGLREGGRGALRGRRQRRSSGFIVVSQLGLATVLLVGAGLLLRSFQTLKAVDPGFRSGGVLTAQIMLPESRYGEADRSQALYDRLEEQVRSLPGVRSVVFGMNHPMENTWWNGISFLDRPAPEEGESPRGIFRPVSAGYFATLGIPVHAGREFTAQDRLDQPGVMVINDAFAQRYFPGESALGERVGFTVPRFIWGDAAQTVFEVVGVVGDVRFNGLREPSEPAFYIPTAQFPYMSMRLMARVSGDPESLAGAVQAEVWNLDSDLPITEIRTLDRIVTTAVAQDRFNALLLGSFALAALLLATTGVYGVLSYTVSQRTREMGVRMAMGAQPRSVTALVVKDAGVMAALGLASGLTASVLLSRFLASLLFGVPANDPVILMGVGLLLGSAALISGLIPGLRAGRTDPMEALRAE